MTEPDNDDTKDAAETAEEPTSGKRRVGGIRWTRVLAFGVLPGLALLLAIGAGYLKWYDSTARHNEMDGNEAVRAATDTTTMMLTYKADTVEKDLDAANDRLTGQFKDSYNSMIRNVVVPEAKQRQISTMASVAGAGVVSASQNHAVVLLFVNQVFTVGTDPPINNPTRARVALDKISGRWLISEFTLV